MNNILVIFGGSGNLAYLKLYPALYSLEASNKLPEYFRIIGVAKSKRTSEEFHETIKKNINSQIDSIDNKVLNNFLNRIEYFSLGFDNDDDYIKLRDHLNNIDLDTKKNGNRIFYFATSPNFFETIASSLSKNNMIKNEKGNQKIVIEKPFGNDLKSAKKLNNSLKKYISEENIYRIDHYLGKDMIENIIYLRFSNPIFNGVWNKDYIDNIQITASEKIGIGARGRYYDDSGALRDMIQNHLLQILSIVTMDMPENFDTECIQKQKIKILKSLKKYSCNEVYDNVVLGQYIGDNNKIIGYKEEKSIPNDSSTETFVALKMFINNKTWKDVPIYLKTGKRLNNKTVYITIEFKKNSLARNMIKQNFKANILQIKIQPEEGINIKFNLKKPNITDEISQVEMDFCKSCLIDYQAPSAYEKIFISLFNNDKLLFTTWDELKYCWKFIDPITKACSDIKSEILKEYIAGSQGPIESDSLLKNDDRNWWSY